MASVPVNTDLDLGGVARVRNLVAPTNPDEPVRNDDSRLGVGGSDPIGTIRYAPSSPGANWLLCDAGVYSQTTEAALFAVLGLSLTGENMTSATRTIPAGTWNAVAWGAGLFVAVGTNLCATSPDGITWTARTIPAGTWSDIAWSGSVFVAVNGAAGAITCATSPDGITWTTRTVPSGAYSSVAWGVGLFAAVAGTGAIITSPDGITWTTRSTTSSGANNIAFGAGLFVTSANSVFYISSDGTTWTSYSYPFSFSSGSVMIAFVDGVFMAKGTQATNGNNPCFVSTDGRNWTPLLSEVTTANSLASGGGLFIAGSNASAPQISTSHRGARLICRAVSQAGPFNDGAYNGAGKFVLVGASKCSTFETTYNTSTHFEVPKITPDDPRLKAYIKKA